MGAVVILKCQSDLFQIVAALRTPRSLASHLDSGQQERDQYSNDCDDDQKFDQRKCRYTSLCVRKTRSLRSLPQIALSFDTRSDGVCSVTRQPPLSDDAV